jgi:hypothetical protein
VCDLVSHGETGLLLDLDRLVDPDVAKSIDTKVGLSSDTIHRLFDPDKPTFKTAAACYRSLLLRLVLDPAERVKMGQAAVSAASARSWHGAMECMVEGYTIASQVTRRKRSEAASEGPVPLRVARSGRWRGDMDAADGASTPLRLRLGRAMRERVVRGWRPRARGVELIEGKVSPGEHPVTGLPLVRTSSVDSNSSICLSAAEEGGAKLGHGHGPAVVVSRPRFVEWVPVRCTSSPL